MPSVDEDRTVLIGVRSLDPGERERLRRSRVRVFTISDVDRLGMEAVMRGALEHVRGTAHVHVSLDMDVLDPFRRRGSAPPCAAASPTARRTSPWSSSRAPAPSTPLQVVEVNPILDRENMTGELAVELICSALGQHIL